MYPKDMYRCFACQAEYHERVDYCVVCGCSGLVGVAPRRRQARFDSDMQVATAADLVRSSWEDGRSAAYPDLALGSGTVALCYGPPGAGKSTMLARLLDGLRGPVALLATEEGVGPALASRLARLKIKRADYVCLRGGSIDKIVDEVRARQCVAVGIDSVTMSTFTSADLRRAVRACGVELVAGTLQVTKENIPAGSNQYIHEADVVVVVQDMTWTLAKSRYQEAAVSGEVIKREEVIHGHEPYRLRALSG